MNRLLIVLVATAALAQPSAPPKPDFPADNEVPNRVESSQLLQAVCPGRVVTGKEVACQAPCPAFTGFAGDDLGWSLNSVARGHFLSPSSDDAMLSTSGCEPHTMNFGGTILLTRRSQGWAMLWYKAGVDTSLCHKLPLPTGREILVCMGEYGAQGNETTSLNVEDLLRPTGNFMAEERNGHIFSVDDTTLTCGDYSGDESDPGPIIRGYIEKVTFETSPGGGIGTLSIVAHHGERAMTPKEVRKCLAEQTPGIAPDPAAEFLPPTKRYRINFLFDGTHFKPAPWNAVTARVFRIR